MPQVFSPPLVLGLKLALGALLVAIASLWLLVYEVLPAYGGLEAPRQPIPFSHQHHVGDDGIDCRYCHTSVERSSFAGIPATGRQVRVPFCVVYDVEGDRITRGRVYMEMPVMMRQLGRTPQPAAVAES